MIVFIDEPSRTDVASGICTRLHIDVTLTYFGEFAISHILHVNHLDTVAIPFEQIDRILTTRERPPDVEFESDVTRDTKQAVKPRLIT